MNWIFTDSSNAPGAALSTSAVICAISVLELLRHILAGAPMKAWRMLRRLCHAGFSPQVVHQLD